MIDLLKIAINLNSATLNGFTVTVLSGSLSNKSKKRKFWNRNHKTVQASSGL